MISFVSAHHAWWHVWGPEPQNAPGPFEVGAKVGNVAPKVISLTNVTDSTGVFGVVNPTEGTTTSARIFFIAEDSNGASDLIDASTIAKFNFMDFANPNAIRTNAAACTSVACSLSVCPTPLTRKNYSCTVQMQYYDVNGTWSMNVSVADLSGVRGENGTFFPQGNRNINFTYRSLAAFVITNIPAAVNWSNLDVVAINQIADAPPLSLENRGNYFIVNMVVNASQLNGTGSNPEHNIPAARFSASANNGGAPSAQCVTGGGSPTANAMIRDLNAALRGFTLPRTLDGPVLGLEEAYFCIPPTLSDLPLSSTQTYTTGVALGSHPWIMTNLP